MSEAAGNPVPRNTERTAEPVAILLVDDNAGNVGHPTEAFTAGEIETEIHVACDGAEALEYPYQRGGYAVAARPALVLLYGNLLRKNSEAGLAGIRTDSDVPKLPVVMLSRFQFPLSTGNDQ